MEIAEINVSYKPRIKAKERTAIRSAKDAYNTFLSKWNTDLLEYQEEFKVMLLNNHNKVLGIFDMAKGGTSGVLVDLRILFATALKASAKKIILAHNHPSGTLEPSEADRLLTRRAVEASRLLEIEISDHLIITNEGYYSFAESDML